MPHLARAIEYGDIRTATRIATQSAASAVQILATFDSERVEQNSRRYLHFVRDWHTSAASEDRITLLRWVISSWATFEHVDGAGTISAELLIQTSAAVLAELAEVSIDAWRFSSPREGGIEPAAALELRQRGKQMLEFHWPTLQKKVTDLHVTL